MLGFGGNKEEQMPEEMVTIKKSEYTKLEKRSKWLGYLEAAGVDNWEGYSYASDLQIEEEV